MDKPRHQASHVAIALIERFEGYRREAARLPDGRWTIGYGHTRSAREGASVSHEDAEALLVYDLRAVAAAIHEAVFTPLSQNQFDALASFVFNIGAENFRHSAVLRRINEGAMLEAAYALEMWRKADLEGERIVVDALVRRRAAEKALFLTPDGGFVPTPSPVVEPKADYGLDLAGPGDAVELAPPLEGPLAVASAAAEDAAPGEREALSPSERAAANLAARLKVLAPEPPPDEPAPPPPQSPTAAEPEPGPFPIAEPEPAAAKPVQDLVAPAASQDFPAPAPAPPVPPARDPEALRRAIFGEPEPQAKPPHDWKADWPLALLAAVGMAVFVGAIAWAFRARPAPGGTVSPLNAGVVLAGFIGILCVASAVYLFLERLSGRDS